MALTTTTLTGIESMHEVKEKKIGYVPVFEAAECF